jgi:hypothetical protein
LGFVSGKFKKNYACWSDFSKETDAASCFSDFATLIIAAIFDLKIGCLKKKGTVPRDSV